MPVELNVPKELAENRLGAVGNLKINLWDKIALNSNLEFSSGKEFGTFLRSQNKLRFEPIPDYFVNAKINFQTSSPSFNLLINPSVYRKFNYYLEDPKNESITEIGGDVNLKWYKSKVFANFFRLNNHTFLDNNGQPQQSGAPLNISQLGGEATFTYGNFHLNPKIVIQNSFGNTEILPLPKLVARANLFWQSKAFKKAAEIQTGIKVYYFSKFASREYFPVLNEFILPGANSYSIGGQPIADAYFNLKVKRMFFFVEAQHFNTTFLKNKSFAAPDYPLYDFRLNLGIVWYLFS